MEIQNPQGGSSSRNTTFNDKHSSNGLFNNFSPSKENLEFAKKTYLEDLKKVPGAYELFTIKFHEDGEDSESEQDYVDRNLRFLIYNGSKPLLYKPKSPQENNYALLQGGTIEEYSIAGKEFDNINFESEGVLFLGCGIRLFKEATKEDGIKKLGLVQI